MFDIFVGQHGGGSNFIFFQGGGQTYDVEKLR